jgi:CO/xanthine dehydrogenase FAD-binding subunit
MAVHFDYHTPYTWDEAAALLSDYDSDAKVLAGN